MNLLLSNDDGIEGDGLLALARELSKKHKVFVIAPDKNRSGVSHCLTMFSSLSVTRVADSVWTCSGTPVDCAVLGLRSSLIKEKIDVCISGINRGANLGTDIIYSGTCAVARQCSFYKVPAIAVSLSYPPGVSDYSMKLDYGPMAAFVSDNLEKLVSLIEKDKATHFLNINGEDPSKLGLEKYRGVKFSSELCCRKYTDRFEVYPGDDENKMEARFIFGHETSSPTEDCDEICCERGFLAVTKVCSEPALSLMGDEGEGDWIL